MKQREFDDRLAESLDAMADRSKTIHRRATDIARGTRRLETDNSAYVRKELQRGALTPLLSARPQIESSILSLTNFI